MTTSPARALESIFTASPEDLSRLHGRLERDAERDGLTDLAYRTVDSPVGSLLLAASESGLIRIAFASEGHDAALEELARRVSPRVLRSRRRLDPVATQLDEYFSRRRQQFELRLDWRLSHGFRRTVLERLTEVVRYGETTTYSRLASASGIAGAVRAAGSACATNPIPLVVPCHRVIRSDGRSGGYRGGPEVKLQLLALEAR